MHKLRRIAVMAGTNTLRAFRSPMNVLWMLVVPVIFGVVTGTLFSPESVETDELYVINEDGSSSAEMFLHAMQIRGYEVHVVGRTEALSSIETGEYPFALVLAAGFGSALASGAPELQIIHGSSYAPGKPESAAKAVAWALAAGKDASRSPVLHDSPRGNVTDISFPKTRSIFGVYVVFAFVALFFRAGDLHKERQNGTLQRLLCVGVPYGEVLAAHILGIGLIGIVQSAVVLTVTGAFGVHWLAGGWLEAAATVGATVFVGSGLAVGLAGFVSNPQLHQGLSGAIPALLAMTGGAYFPLDATPAAVQQLARVNPVYWMMEVLEEGFLYRGISGQSTPLAVLLLIGMLGMVAGVQGFRRMEM